MAEEDLEDGGDCDENPFSAEEIEMEAEMENVGVETYDDVLEEKMEAQKLRDLEANIRTIIQEIPMTANTIVQLESALTALDIELGQKRITDFDEGSPEEFDSVEASLYPD